MVIIYGDFFFFVILIYNVLKLGAKIVATKYIPNKTVLFELCGQLFPFSDQFLVPGINDFSTVTSSVNDRDYMFLGPVAFINHDCKPNVQWHSRNKTLSCVKTIRSISSNEEITVWYGPNFFGFQNCQCQCQTCEDTGRGFYSKKTGEINYFGKVWGWANDHFCLISQCSYTIK